MELPGPDARLWEYIIGNATGLSLSFGALIMAFRLLRPRKSRPDRYAMINVKSSPRGRCHSEERVALFAATRNLLLH